MANFLSRIFGGKSEKRDTTYQGPKPVTTLASVQGGPEYYSEIMKRMGGQGVGFGDTYSNKYASPIIARMRNNFEGYELPELKSELTASGRRGGSAGFDQLRRAYQEQGLAEGDVFSRLQQRNEDQQRNEINDALSRVGAYASNEANLVGNRAQFDYADHTKQLATEDARRDAAQDVRLRGLGAAMMFIPGAQGAGMSMGGFSPTNFDYNQQVPFGSANMSMLDRMGQRYRYGLGNRGKIKG